MWENPPPSRNASRLFAGLVIIGLGALALLDNFGILHIPRIWRFWPLILIALGFSRLLQPRGSRGRAGGIVLSGLGLWLLLENLGLWPYSLAELWPLIVVAVGIYLVWGALGNRISGAPVAGWLCVGGGRAGGSPSEDASRISSFSILGGVEHRSKSQDFQGGDATSILAGCKIDLRQATIKREEAILDVFALWGGVEITVPRNWSVVIQGTPILGAFDDKTDSSKEESGPRLIIRGAVIMGGVEIKN